MNVNDMKVEIAKTLLETNDEAVLIQVKEILNFSKTDLWLSLSDEQKESVFIAREEYKEGKVISHEDIKKKHQKWLIK